MPESAVLISPQEAVHECQGFLQSFVTDAQDILVEEFNRESDAHWFITLGFNLPSPLDALRNPLGRPSLERDHHRRFKFDVPTGKVVSMTPSK